MDLLFAVLAAVVLVIAAILGLLDWRIRRYPQPEPDRDQALIIAELLRIVERKAPEHVQWEGDTVRIIPIVDFPADSKTELEQTHEADGVA